MDCGDQSSRIGRLPANRAGPSPSAFGVPHRGRPEFRPQGPFLEALSTGYDGPPPPTSGARPGAPMRIVALLGLLVGMLLTCAVGGGSGAFADPGGEERKGAGEGRGG